MGEGPLAGLKVLEASGDVAVRYCARLFAQLGAEVATAIAGDDTRIGFAGEAGRAYGRWLDQGKAPIAVEAAKARAWDLVIAGQDAEAIAAAEAAGYAGPLLALTWFHPIGPYSRWRG